MKRLNFALCVFLIFCSVNSFGQTARTVNFFNQIKNYNFSVVLNADSIETEGEDGLRKVKRAEILGFIGDNFQRFQIHFNSVTKNPKNPYQYFAFGKTKVFPFKGTITIKQAYLKTHPDLLRYKQGFANCEVIFYENRKEDSSGFIKGNLQSNFEINAKGQFGYDALMLVSDSFSNNQFIGTWTSYKTNISKTCNWGDYRIPDCGDLDNGAGGFYVSEKYVKNGWAAYMLENKMLNAGKTKTRKNKN